MSKAKAVFSLDRENFTKALQSSMDKKNGKDLIYLPGPEGKMTAFTITESAVFHPDLAKKYPNIKSFSGLSEDGKYKLRLSSSHKGLQSMIINLKDRKAAFMEPLSNRTDSYVVYNREEAFTGKDDFICNTKKLQQTVSKTIVPLVDDQLLRTFRIAVSASGEYTDHHGGGVADALAAINATLTRVNEVFETDLGVRLELIANNDLVIFTDESTDPYGNNLNSEVQNTLTSIIGEENYDVGHLFNKVDEGQDNGNAGFIGSVCFDNRKGSAFSSAFSPEGDVFDLDFVSHELGHQFGANHTWSFESEGTGVQAEPGSGTTIMGYAGIVPGNNVAPNGDDYFHYNSILQISDYLETVSCAETTPLTNSPPVLTPMGDYNIPQGTAFVLEGMATDSDVGDELTYAWEQIDSGVVTATSFGPENPSGANFRSMPPSTEPARYFPRLSSVIEGNLTQTTPSINDTWETVSTIQRDLKFALTVRDNAIGGGQVVSDILDVHVLSSAGPFVITSQTTNETYSAGSVQSITWDVANTNVLPIDAKRVDIFLSLDGGISFPITLAEDTQNDGVEEVLIPANVTNQARIMIKASDNVFFAVNSEDFSIVESPVVLDFQDLFFTGCQPNDIVVPFTYRTFAGFNEMSTFSTNVPPGSNAVFVPSQANLDGTAVTLTISGTNGVAAGEYAITVTSTATSQTVDVPLSLTISDGSFTDVVLQAPGDSELNTAVNPQLSWEANSLYTSYDLEIATDVGFASIVESETTPFNFYQPANLESGTEYFWRVRPNNVCGSGNFGTPFSFTTIQVDCKSVEPNNLPLSISAIGMPTESTSVQFFEDLPIADINVSLEMTHTFLEDLVITLISPVGTRVALLSNTCGSLNNINAVFDDEGSSISCSGDPAISGTISPVGSLSAFNGESTLGEWTLEIQDTANGDGGSLVAFSMEVCVEGMFRPDEDEDGVFDDGDDLCLGTPKGVEVDTSGCPVNRFPADNFEVQLQSESCRNNNDGTVVITATDTSLTYTAILDGNGSTLNTDFTDTHSFENLSAGNYTLCITGTDGSITYQEVCFNIVIDEPELLSALAVAEASQLQLSLAGGDLYNIELNGLITQTQDSELRLELKNGLNTLRVFTNLPCQGSYEETFFVSLNPIVHPNPVADIAKVFLSAVEGEVNVQVFDTNGRLVLSDRKNFSGSELELDCSTLPTGIYYVNIQGLEIQEVLKIIKE